MRYVASYLGTGLFVIVAAMTQPGCSPPAVEALDKPATLEFVDTPLRDVLDYLQAAHSVKIELAPETQKGPQAVDPQMPITKNLKMISLRSALHLLLDPLELEVTVKPDGALLLVPSTKELRAKRVESQVQRAAREKLGKTLKEETTLEFVDCPLKDIIAFLADQHDCTIVLDARALAETEVEPDVPITGTFRGPLDEALKILLLPYDLQVKTQDEVLLVVAVDKPAKEKPSPQVAKALESKLDFDLERPLPNFANYLTKQTSVHFLLHHAALKAADIDTTRTLTIKAQGVTPEEALQRSEPKLPLKLIERDGVVLISVEARK